MIDFYDDIGLPLNCKIDKIIAKNKFYNKDRIDDDYQYIFDKYVDKVTLKYALKSELLNIPKIQDEFQEYSEIEVLEVEINNYIAVYDIAMVIGRNIPYPLIIVFCNKDRFKIGSYWTRENLISNYKNVVEDIVFTGWFKKEKYFGRIKNIIKEMHYVNIEHKNMYEMFNNYYKVIEKYKSNYISINDVCYIFSQIKGMPRKKKFILKECVCTSIDENIYKKVDIYKRDKMDKYNNKILNEKIMICKDDLYQFIYDYSKIRFKSYDIFDKRVQFLKRRKDIKDSLKIKRNKWDCYFFDGKICINSQSINYEKVCKKADYCEFFKKEYKNNNMCYTYVLKDIQQEKIFNNIQIGIVEYGDTIELREITKNEIKVFFIINNNDGELPDIPKLCIGNKIGYKFKYKNSEYEIINIKKNNIRNQSKIMQ